MSKVQFTEDAMKQLHQWSQENIKTVKRIVDLMDSIRQDPFTGIGKPEALKHQYRGYWSRRITDEHRLIYKVDSERNVTIYSLVSHYPQD